MNDEDEVMARALRAALPPVGEPGPERDLWPELTRRLSSRGPSRSRVDWVLGALAAMWLLAFPGAIGGLCYLL